MQPTFVIHCGAVRDDKPDLPCILDHSSTVHKDERGDTWRTEDPPSPSRPEPSLVVVRQRCGAALAAARARAHGESFSEKALADAVLDIPILLAAVERLSRIVTLLGGEAALYGPLLSPPQEG